MKFRDLETLPLRRELKKRDFYEDIIFPDERGKKGKFVRESVETLVAKWLYTLWKCKQIKIRKFKDLFNVLDEIVFPIKINECYGVSCFKIRFIDSKGNEYYMVKTLFYDDCSIENYMIERIYSPLELLVNKKFHCHVSRNDGISLIETTITQLNSKTAVRFNYEKYVTEAEIQLYDGHSKMKIRYPKMNKEFDKKVLTFLLDMNGKKWYHYDIFPVLKCFSQTLLSDEKASISITATVNDEISSKVEVVNGIVQEYITTKIISEGEIEINRKIFAKRLKEFLGDNS